MNSQNVLEGTRMPELRYAVVLEPSPIAEGGGYSVTVPALPEIATEGASADEALEMARDAITLSLQARRDLGLEIPPSDAEGARLEIVKIAAA